MDLAKKLRQFGKVRTNEPMSKHTTFKIGGPVALYIDINAVEDVPAVIALLDEVGMEYIILGGGSNMLWQDEPYEGAVITILDSHIEIDGETVLAHAGAQTVKVAQASVKEGLEGFAWGVGVPGTIGGAVRGNAGAMGKEMKDDVAKIEVLVNGEVVEFLNRECDFSYRNSIFKLQGGIVLKVWLKLKNGDAQASMKKALEALQYRNTTQPKGFASTGCIFKNFKIQGLSHASTGDSKFKIEQLPQEFIDKGVVSAGWMVDQAGMKGVKIGDAQVSDVHGNFIVNLGKATAADVKALIAQVKQAVYSKFGVELEEEIYMHNS